MTYIEMKKAEAALLIAVNNPSHTDDGECDCLDCHYARCDAEMASREPKKQRGATKAQLEHRAYMLKCCVWCGIPFSMHSVELTQDCANARS